MSEENFDKASAVKLLNQIMEAELAGVVRAATVRTERPWTETKSAIVARLPPVVVRGGCRVVVRRGGGLQRPRRQQACDPGTQQSAQYRISKLR